MKLPTLSILPLIRDVALYLAAGLLGGDKLAKDRKLTMTNTGIGLAGAGVAAALATGTDPLESVRVLIGLGKQAWPHILIIVGALQALAGFFRRAGREG